MGCLFACFGSLKKHKHRRKPINKVQPRDRGLGSYKQLDSSPSIKFNITERSVCSDSELRSVIHFKGCCLRSFLTSFLSFFLFFLFFGSRKPEEQSNIKTKKKVSFNLTVKICEPLLTDENKYNELEIEEAKQDDEEEEKDKARLMRSYPPNYRYGNFLDSYDEDEDIVYELSDPDDNDSDEDEELKITGLDGNANERGLYVCPVLNPVENLTQWKALKARTMLPHLNKYHHSKENNAIESESNIPMCSENFNHFKTLVSEEVSVDTSLSNWLVSTNISSKKDILDKSNSVTSREQSKLKRMNVN